MTDKPTRRELLRPLHLLTIAFVLGVFAAVVTLFSTGAFTDRVNQLIAAGTYQGLTPIALSLVVGGGAFIVTLLVMAMLILAVDPSTYSSDELDSPVLYDEDAAAEDAASGDSAGEGPAAS